MDQSAALAELAAAIPQLSQVPQCILPAYGAIAAAGCGPDLACICRNDNFFITLQGVLFKGFCTNPVDAEESVLSTQKICGEAVPWLNENRGSDVVVSTSVLLVLATIVVIMRIFARRISKLNFGWDDWLVLLALLFSYGMAISQYLAVRYGFGRHLLMIPVQDITSYEKCFLATTLTFPVSVTAAKLSILFFYHRIFIERRFRIASMIIGVVTIAWFITFIFLQFFDCIPFAYYWNRTIPHGHCISPVTISIYGVGIGDVATNIAILILPIPSLLTLQMPWQKKAAVILIFLLGSFATVGCIVRIPLTSKLKTKDITYTTVNSGIWLNVELDVGIISVCLPMLRPLFSKAFLSGIRSPFSPSRSSAGYSRRFPDVEKQGYSANSSGRPNTLAGSNNNNSNSNNINNSTGGSGNHHDNSSNNPNNANIYTGGGKAHRTWFNTAVAGKGGSEQHDDQGSEGSWEEMVPVGRIMVRHDVDSETKNSNGSAVQIPPP